MKLLHFPENPTGIYVAAGAMLLASVLTIVDLGLSSGVVSFVLITAVLGVGLAIGILYRSFAVWIMATVLASIHAVVHAFQLIFLMMAVSSAGEYLLFAV